MPRLNPDRAQRARDALVECLECSDLSDADRQALEEACEVLADRLSIGELDPGLSA